MREEAHLVGNRLSVAVSGIAATLAPGADPGDPFRTGCARREGRAGQYDSGGDRNSSNGLGGSHWEWTRGPCLHGDVVLRPVVRDLASRAVYALARDGGMPKAKFFSQVNPKTRNTPGRNLAVIS